MFSVSSSDEPDYWAQADYDTWLLEMAGDRWVKYYYHLNIYFNE